MWKPRNRVAQAFNIKIVKLLTWKPCWKWCWSPSLIEYLYNVQKRKEDANPFVSTKLRAVCTFASDLASTEAWTKVSPEVNVILPVCHD